MNYGPHHNQQQHYRHTKCTSFSRFYPLTFVNILLPITLLILAARSLTFDHVSALVFPPLSSSFSSSSSLSPSWQKHGGHLVVIGKIIVDEYGRPSSSFPDKSTIVKETDEPSTTPTVGGGGPQAAWGAAAALAALSHLQFSSSTSTSLGSKPPSQPVTLIGAVGSIDWTNRETTSLLQSLDSCCAHEPILIPKEDHVTPRIQLWHDDEQNIQWFPLNDSFGDKGANGLWKDTPSVNDVLSIIKNRCNKKQDEQRNEIEEQKQQEVSLHCIIEGGVNGAGEGGDLSPVLDTNILQHINFISVEPVTFPEKHTNRVSSEDANHCSSLLNRVIAAVASSSKSGKKGTKLVAFSPDRQLFDSLPLSFVESATTSEELSVAPPPPSAVVDSFAVRDGPNGSFLRLGTYWEESKSTKNSNEKKKGTSSGHQNNVIPAAKLTTPNGEPVNPTGAGNAYSAAYAAARSIGRCLPYEAACIATGVGAVVCEYDHLPPWEWNVIKRICKAAMEVSREEITKKLAVKKGEK